MHLAWRLGYRETREPALQPRFRYGWARYGCSTVGRNAPRLAARLSRNARAYTATSFPLWLGAVWVFHSGTQCTSPSGSVIAKRDIHKKRNNNFQVNLSCCFFLLCALLNRYESY